MLCRGWVPKRGTGQSTSISRGVILVQQWLLFGAGSLKTKDIVPVSTDLGVLYSRLLTEPDLH